MKEIIELSWQTQVILVGGYLAYIIAYSGRRENHKTFDTLLILLCFGGVGLLVFGVTDSAISSSFSFKEEISGFLAIVCCILAGTLWRACLRELASKTVNKLSGSNDDGLFSAWETLTQTPALLYSQINVQTKSGNTLECYFMGDLNNLPNGPCILGGDGSIAMYVTHITDSEGHRRPANNLQDEDGARITYIPNSEIVEVDIRRKPKR